MKAIDPQAAMEQIWKLAPEYAKAKSERVYLEEFRKSKKALLMQGHIDLPVSAQEREAYADDEYVALLDGLKAAVEQEELLRWRMTSAQAAIEIWRTESANARQEGRATQ